MRVSVLSGSLLMGQFLLILPTPTTLLLSATATASEKTEVYHPLLVPYGAFLIIVCFYYDYQYCRCDAERRWRRDVSCDETKAKAMKDPSRSDSKLTPSALTSPSILEPEVLEEDRMEKVEEGKEENTMIMKVEMEMNNNQHQPRLSKLLSKNC